MQGGSVSGASNEEMTLIEASAYCGLAVNTLRVLLHRRRLEGRKRGRDWFVLPAAIARYLASRDSRGRRPRDVRARQA